MAKTAEKKVVSLPWPELDKIDLAAFWIDKTEPVRFAVERRHDGIRRGRWEFLYSKRNEWECTRGGPQYLREERVFQPKPDPRETDESRIPNDIELKAREFLAAELELKPRKARAGNSD